MIELKPCCKVPFPERLFEGYEIGEESINANVNTSKVLDMMKHFATMHNEPMFFVLEIPRKFPDEITESKILYDSDEYDVYFIDGLDSSAICELLNAVGHFLVIDGMNLFGVGVHSKGEEILFGRYNVMTIYTKNFDTYKGFFEKFGIPRTNNLVTAWDTFDKDHPGECLLHTSESTGKTIYDIPDTYKDYGMYLYETVKMYDGPEEIPITYADLIGKVILVGITYYTKDNEFVEQKQFWGRVTEANESGVTFVQSNGEKMDLPPDLSSTERARPGEYKLRSTGEVVVNPDFLAKWNSIKE